MKYYLTIRAYEKNQAQKFIVLFLFFLLPIHGVLKRKQVRKSK